MFAYIPYELGLIKTLLSYRIDALNPFFVFLNNLDQGLFYCMVAIFCFTVINPKLGVRCFIMLAVLLASNYFFKHLFMQPRPLILDPSLGLINAHSPYGLPSGGAQGAASIATFFMHYFKGKGLKYSAIAYVILICISRIYLGMHFLSDVLLGCFLGFIFTWLLLKYIDLFLNKITQSPALFGYGLGFATLALGVVFNIPLSYQSAVGLVSGAIVTEYWLTNSSSIYSSFNNLSKVIYFIVATILLNGVFFIMKKTPHAMPFLLFGLFHFLLMTQFIIYGICRKIRITCN